MKFYKKYLSSILLSLTILITILFYYSPMFAFEEGLQIFMLTTDFFVDTCFQPGGFSNYLGYFITQFFMYNNYLTIFMILIFTGYQLIIKKIFEKIGCEKLSDCLSILCSISLFVSILDYNILIISSISVLIGTSAILLADVFKNEKNTLIFISILTPIVYWLSGGIGCIIYIIGTSLIIYQKFGFRNLLKTITIETFLLVLTWLLTKNILQNDSLGNYFIGIEYYRHPDEKKSIWAIAISIIIVCLLLSQIKIKEENKKIINILKSGFYAISMIYFLSNSITKYSSDYFSFYQYDKLVRYRRFGEIINLGLKQKPTNELSKCYINLALSEKGQLDSKMFNFFQTGIDGLISTEIDTQDKSIVNSEIYFRLGLINIAERLAIDSEESSCTFQKSARQYKRLAEIAIIKKNKSLAIRYLKKLKATLFYKSWASRAEKYLEDSTSVEAMSDWKIEPLKMNYDFFFSEKYKSDLFVHLLINNPNNIKLLNYYTCSLLLEKDLEQLNNFLSHYNRLDNFGLHICEALIYYYSVNKHEEFQKMMQLSNELTINYQNYYNYVTSPSSSNLKEAEKLFGNTYWFYYHYVN
ncbi:MAG: DUF6057 family protein [Bacteroidales bacterium]|nr:DUF6057 family protein [Bacteroidales bacterium]